MSQIYRYSNNEFRTKGSLMYPKQAKPVSAKTLVIDLLSTMPARHPVPVGALVRAAALFGIGENSMRVALARLRSRGSIESDTRGFYRLSRKAQPVNRKVRSWPTLEQGVCDWDGSYLAVETSGLPRRDRRGAKVRDRALRLLGFERLSPALMVRPNNLVGGATTCRERLVELGFAPTPVLFQLNDLDPKLEQRARNLWATADLEARYAETRANLERSTARLPERSLDEAMAESFQIGGEAVRQLVLDPLLPKEIIDTAARSALVEAMRQYDRVGREAWKQWAGASVELERSPVDMGTLDSVPSEVPGLASR